MPLTHIPFAFKSCSKYFFQVEKERNIKTQGTNFVWKEHTAVESSGYNCIKIKKKKNTLIYSMPSFEDESKVLKNGGTEVLLQRDGFFCLKDI